MPAVLNPQPRIETDTITKFAVLIWGILMVVAGLFLLTRPVVTAIIWVEILAFSWVIGGIFDIVAAFNKQTKYRLWRAIAGIISVIAGLYIIGNPILSTFFVLNIAFVFFAVSAAIDGIVNITAGIKASGGTRVAAIVLGILQLIIGIWIFLHPIAGMLALIPVFSILLIVGGILAVIAAFRIDN